MQSNDYLSKGNKNGLENDPSGPGYDQKPMGNSQYHMSNQFNGRPQALQKRKLSPGRIFISLIFALLLSFGFLFLLNFLVQRFLSGKGALPEELAMFSMLRTDMYIAAGFLTFLLILLFAIPANRPGRTAKNVLRVLLIPLVIVTVWYFGVTTALQDVFMFPRVQSEQTNIDVLRANPGYKELKIDLDGGKHVGGWIYTPAGTDSKKPLFIYFGGNAEEATGSVTSFEGSRAKYFEGYNILMMDLPGYGLSNGNPNDNENFEYASATYDYAKTLPFVDSNRIVVGGWSIGTGTAIRLAADKQSAGLLLLAPFQNGTALVNGYKENIMNLKFPLPFITRNAYDNEKHARAYKGPVFVATSKTDNMISDEQSIALAKNFENVELIVLEDEAHFGYWYNEKIEAKIQTFLAEFR
jgi:pimeloyl-ACP methyl ester carboxylesterase